jgi:cyclophilin family peptidyl-prolyl cis-trans isomerase/HEAT repeat protein
LSPIEEAEDLRNPDAPAIVGAFQSKIPGLRARAAIACGRIQKPACVDPLLALLGDPVAAVKLEAVFALGQLGWRSDMSGGREKEITEKIAPLLRSEDERVRRLAVEAVGKTGLLETPNLLTPLLSDPSPALRAEALMALYRYRLVLRLRDAAQTVPDLPETSFNRVKDLASDQSPLVRRQVAYYFARVKDARGIPVERALLNDRNDNVRLFAIQGLVKNPDPGSAKVLVGTARSKGPLANRLAALQALAAAQTDVGQELDPLQTEASYHLRTALVQVWSAFADAHAGQLESIFSKDPSAIVRGEALAALTKRKSESGQVAVRALVQSAFQNPNPIVRAAAVQGSSVFGGDREKTLVEWFAKETDPAVLAAIVESVGEIESAPAFQVIERGLEHGALMVRGTAGDVLVKRKEKNVPEVAARTFAASLDHRWNELRENLVAVLPNETLRQVVTSDPAASVAEKARAELLRRGESNVPAAPAPKLTFSPFRDLRFERNPVAVIETDRGVIEIELFAKDAPIHVANFVGHARKGFYDGLTWHRVVPNFVIQGGDPDNSGWGDAGFSVRAEVNHRRYVRGTLGMPRSAGFDTGGVQIFLTHIPTPHLDGQYTVFGQVRSGLQVIDRIELGDRVRRISIAGVGAGVSSGIKE